MFFNTEVLLSLCRMEKQPPRGVLLKMFLRIKQSSEKNTFAGVSFLTKLQLNICERRVESVYQLLLCSRMMTYGFIANLNMHVMKRAFRKNVYRVVINKYQSLNFVVIT